MLKLDESICERYSAKYSAFCSLSLKNLTKFNRQTNIAYIGIHAIPDLYSSFESVVYIHTGPARWTDIGAERLFGHIYGICDREFVGKIMCSHLQ